MDATEKIIRDEITKVVCSFAKVEGFMQAAINEMHPAQTAYGAIEGMLVYQTPTVKGVYKETRLIRNELGNARNGLRDLMDSLRDAKDEMVKIYELEIEHVKNTNG